MLQVNELIGFGVSGGITSIAQQDSAVDASSDTITVPASVLRGDLLVLFDIANTDGSNGGGTPAGFTSIIADDTNPTLPFYVSYKIAIGTEASTSITGLTNSGGGDASKALYVFRGDAPIVSVTVSTPNFQTTSGNPSAQNVAASSGVAPLVVLGCYAGFLLTINPRTMSPAKDGEIAPDTYMYLAYKIYNTSPQVVSVDMDDEGGSNSLGSFYISVR